MSIAKDSRLITQRQAAYLGEVASVLNDLEAELPPPALYVLLKATLALMDLFMRQHREHKSINCEFTLNVRGRHISTSRRQYDGTTTLSASPGDVWEEA